VPGRWDGRESLGLLRGATVLTMDDPLGEVEADILRTRLVWASGRAQALPWRVRRLFRVPDPCVGD